MQDAAAQPFHDVGHRGREVPQAARGWDHRVARAVQGVDGLREIPPLTCGRPAEHAGEGTVDRVGGAKAVRVDRNRHILALGPMLEAVGIHAVGFGLEGTGLGQGQIQTPAAFRFTQRDVAPGRSRGIAQTLPQQGEGLFPHPGAAGEVGAQEGPPAGSPGTRGRQVEDHPVSHEAEQPGTTGWVHHGVGHAGIFIPTDPFLSGKSFPA